MVKCENCQGNGLCEAQNLHNSISEHHCKDFIHSLSVNYERIWNAFTKEVKTLFSKKLQITTPSRVINRKWSDLVLVAKRQLRILLKEKAKCKYFLTCNNTSHPITKRIKHHCLNYQELLDSKAYCTIFKQKDKSERYNHFAFSFELECTKEGSLIVLNELQQFLNCKGYAFHNIIGKRE